MKIIPYEEKYLNSWLRCRLLSGYGTAEQYNGLKTTKDSYPENPTIDLICVNDQDEVVGLQQTVLDTPANKETMYQGLSQQGAYFMENYVHPDYQRQGIATALFQQTCQLAKDAGVSWLEIWTCGDEAANHFYQKAGAQPIYHYWQVQGYSNPWPKNQCQYDENGFLREVLREGQHFPYLQEITNYQVYREEDLQALEVVKQNKVTYYLLKLAENASSI